MSFYEVTFRVYIRDDNEGAPGRLNQFSGDAILDAVTKAREVFGENTPTMQVVGGGAHVEVVDVDAIGEELKTYRAQAKGRVPVIRDAHRAGAVG